MSLSEACAGVAEMVANAVATTVVSEVRMAAIFFDLFMLFSISCVDAGCELEVMNRRDHRRR